MAIILDGKKLRDKLLDNLKTKVEKLQTKPTLVVILVGDNPASKIYVNNKKKMAEKIGKIVFITFSFEICSGKGN